MLNKLEKIWLFLKNKISTKIFFVNNFDELFDLIKESLDKHKMSYPEILIISGRTGYENIVKPLEDQFISKTEYKNIKKLIISKESFDKKYIDEEVIRRHTYNLYSSHSFVIIGIGGGFVLDIAKYIANYIQSKDLILIPTTLSSNAIISPFSVIKTENRIEAFKTVYPDKVFIYLDLLLNIPKRHITSGYADSLAKYTALYDLRLSYWFSDLSYDKTLFKIARQITKMLISHFSQFTDRTRESIKNLLTAELIDGALMGLSNTTRIVAGSEHLIALALTLLSSQGLHGEYVGIGTIISSYIQGKKWFLIRDILSKIDAPVNIHQLLIDEKTIIDAIKMAPDMRNWYTILGRFKDEKKIREMLKECKVLE